MGGRGRGGRRNFVQNIEGLEVTPGELAPCLQPPPSYPIVENHPAPINLTPSAVIQLGYKVDLLSYLSREVKQLNYTWKYFPSELRPGHGKRPASSSENTQAKIPATDINQLLAKLEKKEAAQVKVEDKEDKDEKEDDGEQFADSDEEIDDETDYNQNYFDNGEGYLDEDDDGDEGPVY